MKYQRISPVTNISKLIDCYWHAESDSVIPEKKKIIPDGFTEIIFHYRDPYRINLSGRWQKQGKCLLAGQIRKFFYLENTGASGMFGIKFRPAALTNLFGLKMIELTDRVVPLQTIVGKLYRGMEAAVQSQIPIEDFVPMLNQFFSERLTYMTINEKIEQSINLIFSRKGDVTVAELTDLVHITERQLQRLFNHFVGLSPKFYCRIIRFNHIFSLMEQPDSSWVEVALHSGYYDQAHFIRNFQAFTGEDPSAYLFEEQSLANFFMKRK